MIQTQRQTPVSNLTQGRQVFLRPSHCLFHGYVAPHSYSNCFSSTFTTEQRPLSPIPVSEDRRATGPAKVEIQQYLESALHS